MQKNIIFEKHNTPVKYYCDVCVAGGGVAGIAAALSAKRAGRAMGEDTRVILLEREFMLGGLATAGLVTIYLPICDGYGRQISYGLCDELLRLSIEYGAEDMYPDAWLDNDDTDARKKQRFMVQFNAQLFALSAERVLKEEGVEIIYGATVADAVTENEKITHIIIEGKGGREAISVSRSAVDATGDADLCRAAGAKTAIFSEGNKLAAWYYGFGSGNLKLYMCGVHDIPSEDADSDIPDLKRYSGLDTKELSGMVLDAHQALMANFKKKRMETPDLLPTTISTIPAVRMTRRLVGIYEQDICEDRVFHNDSVGIYPNWRKRGPVYELPLSTLYGKEINNLLVAGRCISTTEAMWDITRVIPVCAVTGEAAGAAAVIFDDMSRADVSKVQKYLQYAGVILHASDLEEK